jgi:hypothetical protein
MERNRGVNDPAWALRRCPAPRSGVVHASAAGGPFVKKTWAALSGKVSATRRTIRGAETSVLMRQNCAQTACRNPLKPLLPWRWLAGPHRASRAPPWLDRRQRVQPVQDRLPPCPTVSPPARRLARTYGVMTIMVRSSPMRSAATIVMVIDNSRVTRRSRSHPPSLRAGVRGSGGAGCVVMGHRLSRHFPTPSFPEPARSETVHPGCRTD